VKYCLALALAAFLLFSMGCSDDDSTTGPGTQTVSTPEFDPPGGSYNTIQHVKITCSTSDASVYYTTDGADPDESSTLCAAGDSIEVGSTLTLKARAYKDGMDCSDIAEATYTIDFDNVATPTFDPPGASYSTVQHVKINCATQDASIYYTLDGTDPDESSTLFSEGDSIKVDSSVAIKAKAYKSGMDPSGIATATYTIDLLDVATPYFEPAEGLYNSPQDVIIHCATMDARIFYTTDGSDPDTNSTEFIFQTVIPVETTTTIRARAYKEGMDPSAIAQAIYTIDLPDVATPTVNPPTGAYGSSITVLMDCSTSGADIYYTLDGTVPDTGDLLYPGSAVTVNSTCELQARAFKSGMDPSGTVTRNYAIIPDMVAYYPFNGNAIDVSGNAHNGTVYGATSTTDRFGDSDAAFDFDGTDDYIELSDEAAFDFTEYTISFWTRITTLPTVPGPTTPGYYCAVSKAGVNLGNYTIRLYKYGGASYCNLSVAHGTNMGNWNTLCNENIYLDTYYHIVVTLSDEVRCYYNGVLYSTSSSMPDPIQTDGNVFIGKFDSATDPFYFNGIIDDVRFYSRALTAQEIEDLYQVEN